MPQTAEFEKCRGLLHAWEPMAPPLHHQRQGAHTLFMVCVRCGSEKTTDMEPDGTISYSKIDHSPSYRKFLDEHNLDDRRDFRLMIHERINKRRRAKTV